MNGAPVLRHSRREHLSRSRRALKRRKWRLRSGELALVTFRTISGRSGLRPGACTAKAQRVHSESTACEQRRRSLDFFPEVSFLLKFLGQSPFLVAFPSLPLSRSGHSCDVTAVASGKPLFLRWREKEASFCFVPHSALTRTRNCPVPKMLSPFVA